MASTAPTSRVREQPAGEEEASAELKLGEFNNVPTLTLSEARLLINAVTTVKKRSLEDNDIFKKTMDYLNLFARYKNKDNIEAIEQILNQRQDLHSYERSQLANLAISTEQDEDGDRETAATQAKQLIPSLADKISDEDLTQLLEDLDKLRTTSGE